MKRGGDAAGAFESKPEEQAVRPTTRSGHQSQKGREYSRNGHQSKKGRENVPQCRRLRRRCTARRQR
eukprot:4818654-Pyramimonas_sp.AAC.1